MPKEGFDEAVGTGPITKTISLSLVFAQMVDVTLTDVEEKASPTLVLSKGIDFGAVLMGMGQHFSWCINHS